MKSKKKLSKIMRIVKAINRQLALEKGTFIRGGAHLTSKRDKLDKQSNTVRRDEY